MSRDNCDKFQSVNLKHKSLWLQWYQKFNKHKKKKTQQQQNP